MQIFKFGGASVKDAAAIRNVAAILKSYANEKLVIVISAMGKTTNALEAITAAYFYEKEERNTLFNNLKSFHYDIIEELFEKKQAVRSQVDAVFADITRHFNKIAESNYNFIYDQVVSSGELLSTILVSAYLNEQSLPTEWLDVRTCVKTDNVYREPNVNWELTRQKINDIVPPITQDKFVVTQGFLGSTPEFFTTTLGREGSDFTAAIFCKCS